MEVEDEDCGRAGERLTGPEGWRVDLSEPGSSFYRPVSARCWKVGWTRFSSMRPATAMALAHPSTFQSAESRTGCLMLVMFVHACNLTHVGHCSSSSS